MYYYLTNGSQVFDRVEEPYELRDPVLYFIQSDIYHEPWDISVVDGQIVPKVENQPLPNAPLFWNDKVLSDAIASLESQKLKDILRLIQATMEGDYNTMVTLRNTLEASNNANPT